MAKNIKLIIMVIVIIHTCSEDPTYNNPYSSNYDPEEWMPANLKVEQQNIHTVKLSWKQVEENIDGFKIDRKVDTSDWEIEYATIDKKNKSYIDTAAIPTKENRYRVYAYADENNSASLEKQITPKFPAPDSLEIEQLSVNELKLSWNDNSDGEDGFKIDKKIGNGEWKESYAEQKANKTSFIDTNATPDKVNYYKVYGYKDDIFSNKIEISKNVEFAAPSGLEIEQISDVKLALIWEDNSKGESEFKIDRKISDSDWEVEYSEVPENTEEWYDTNPVYGSINKYRVYAYSNDETSDYKEASINNIISPPTSLSGNAIDYTKVELNWIDNCNFEEGYKIQRKEVSGSFTEISDLDANTISFIDNNVEIDKEYKYRVCAYTSNNRSNYTESNIVNTSNKKPTAMFTISPDSGNINTDFTFDASSSSDIEDNNTDLVVRWDFENDGTWDTDFTAAKITSHKFSNIGIFTIKLQVKDSEGAINDTTQTVKIYNTPPNASFTVSPDSGTVNTEFTFDASSCSDLEDDNSELRVRWDWENDGKWDTEHSTIKSKIHQYSSIGTYEVKMEVKDCGGLIDNSIKNISIENIEPELISKITVSGSPTLGSDGTIYVCSGDNNLYAINLDGTIKWKFQTGDHIGSSPTVSSDGTIYFGSYDNKLYAIDQNGIKKWEFKTNYEITTSPAIGKDGTIYFGDCINNFYALNPDGSKKWYQNIETGTINSSPVINSNGTIYIAVLYNNDRGGLLAINFNGTKKWSFPFDAYASGDPKPSIGLDGTIYIGTANGANTGLLYAINPNGTKKWEIETEYTIKAAPAIDQDGTIYIGSCDARASYHYDQLYAINPNGTKKWTFSVGDWIKSTPAIDENGTIYAACYDGTLYVINPRGTKRWQINTTNSHLFSPTIDSHGIIYLGNSNDGVYLIRNISPGKADSPWPMFQHDPQHTGRQP